MQESSKEIQNQADKLTKMQQDLINSKTVSAAAAPEIKKATPLTDDQANQISKDSFACQFEIFPDGRINVHLLDMILDDLEDLFTPFFAEQIANGLETQLAALKNNQTS